MEYTLLQNSSFEVKDHSGTSIFKVGENGNVYVGATQITPASYVSVSGNNTFTGTNTFNGNVTFGAYIDGDLLPTMDTSSWLTTAKWSLGNSSNKWKDAYINNGYIGALHFTWQSSDTSITPLSIFANLHNAKNTATDTLSRDYYNIVEKSSNATISLGNDYSNACSEYKGEITNTASSSIDLTFTGVSKIMTNDQTDASVNGNVLTLGAGVTVEFSIVNGHMVVVNWAVV